MSEFFTKVTPNGMYRVTVGSRDGQYVNGSIRIEPPVIISDDAMEVLAEGSVVFSNAIVGREASLLSFSPADEEKTRELIEPDTPIIATVERLVTYLGYLSSDEFFRENY